MSLTPAVHMLSHCLYCRKTTVLDLREREYDRPACFDYNFFMKLNYHLNVHLQLLAQNLALSGEICDADHVWVTTLKMMVSSSKSYFLYHITRSV